MPQWQDLLLKRLDSVKGSNHIKSEDLRQYMQTFLVRDYPPIKASNHSKKDCKNERLSWLRGSKFIGEALIVRNFEQEDLQVLPYLRSLATL